MKRELKMLFKTDNGSSTTITIPEPSKSLDQGQVRTAMETIISDNIFETLNGELVAPVNAKIVEVSQTVYDYKI